MASQGAHMHTHTHTHTHGTKQVKFVYTHTHTHTNRCTWHIQVHTGNTGVCVVHVHSCACTHVHANTHGLHKQKKKKKAPNSHPCYFCSFRINLMDRMSGGITTDWWNQDTKCSTERDTLHCSTRGTSTHTHTHTHGYTTTATVTELTRACRQTHTCTQKDRHCYAFSQSGWHTLRRLFVRGQCVWVVLGIRRGITGLIVSQGCRLLPLRFPPPQMKVAAEVEDGMQVFQLLNSSKLFDLLSSNCKSQVADSPVYEPSHCISPLARVQLCGLTKLALFPTNEF